MSLYDGVDIDGVPLESDRSSDGLEKADISKLSGWSASYKLMQTQLQRKKVAQAKPMPQKSRTINQVVLDNVRKKPEDDNLQEMAGGQDPFVDVDPSALAVVDEYDPMKPNEYEEVKQRFRESRDRRPDRNDDERDRRYRDRDQDRDADWSRDRDRDRGRDRGRDRDRDRERDRERDRDRDRERERERERDRERDNGSDDEEKFRAPARRGGAAIAPPPSLMEDSLNSQSNLGEFRGELIPERKLFQGSQQKEKPNVGFEASPVASQIMARYGWKDGQGLGKQEQGMNTCLQVEKTSKRGGKIINQEKVVEPARVEPEPVTAAMRNPSKVVLLRNMVGPGDVDSELEPEVAEECSKYGEVAKVLIYEIPQGVADDEAVRIFIEFTRMESATKAVIDLNGRYFGGRVVKGSFYNLDRFRRLDLSADV